MDETLMETPMETPQVETENPYIHLYKKKLEIRGASAKQRNLRHKTLEFNRYFDETLNREDALINGVPAQIVMQDHSQSNNKDLSDDKYIIAKNETSLNIGDYVTWQGSNWLVFTKEHKTIPTHQQAKVKIVNELVKWINNDGEVVNEGKGWGAYVQSQTLYTMGVAVTPKIQVVDSKMSMFMQRNEDTRSIRMDYRLFVGRRVYKVKFIDDVSRPGLISYLLDEDTIGEYDNVDLSVADYYKYYDQDGNSLGITKYIEREDGTLSDVTVDKPLPIQPEEPDVEGNVNETVEAVTLYGEDNPKIGRAYTYESSDPVDEWIVEHTSSIQPYQIINRTNDRITIEFTSNFRFVGDSVTLIAKVGDTYISKPLVINKRY